MGGAMAGWSLLSWSLNYCNDTTGVNDSTLTTTALSHNESPKFSWLTGRLRMD